MSTPSEVAYQALNLAKQNERDITAHEDLCAERYGNINSSISELKSIFKWAGGALFTLLLAAFGFLINQTVTANHSLTDSNMAMSTAASRIELLQSQLNEERRNRGNPPTN